MCRGEEAAQAARETAQKVFEQGAAGGDLPTATAGADGLTIVAALNALGFVASNKEARRKLEEGAVKVDGEVLKDPHHLVQPEADSIKISLGAKKHGLITN